MSAPWYDPQGIEAVQEDQFVGGVANAVTAVAFDSDTGWPDRPNSPLVFWTGGDSQPDGWLSGDVWIPA